MFGDIVDDTMRLNDAGQLVQEVWSAIPRQYPGIAIDAFVLMPNHIHGIIMIGATDGTVGATGTPTVGEIVLAYKARVTVAINQHRGTRGVPVWQRNFYDHIIRDNDALDRIRQYIVDNPARWAHDPENTRPAGGTR
jgi:putative transposase